MSLLRILDGGSVAETARLSREQPRGRANHNFHPELADPVQRFLNVVQPASYVRPHEHEGDRFELFLLLEGRAAALAFDGDGNATESVVLEPGGARAVEIPGGVCHTIVALAADTLLFEIKPGPYRPLTDKDFAQWAPAEGTPESAALLARWTHLVEPE